MTDREVRELLDEYGRGLRAEFRRELLELRGEVADLVAEEMYQRVQAVTALRFESAEAAWRTLENGYADAAREFARVVEVTG